MLHDELLHDKLIVCFSTLSWDFLWLRHQELMARFANAGNRVLFVEPIGIRMPKWEDRKQIVARVTNRRHAGTQGMRQVMQNLWVLDPLVNPFQQIGFVHRRNASALTAQTKHAVAQLGGGESLVWTYVPTPLAREVIANLSPKLVVYDCMDALTENPKGVFSSFAESEKILSREADLVFVTSPALLERQLPLNPHTFYVPHGVQYEKFAFDTAPEPQAFNQISHPRLAFFGGIDERVDLALLETLAGKHPEWQIVLIGIVRTDVSRLEKYSNVHFLGQKTHAELPAYLHHSDVLMMPYLLTEYSHYMNPAKLHECLAVGKPTIVTDLPCFAEFRTVLSVASSNAEFEKLLADAIAENDNGAARAARQACARENTWERRFREINARMMERLA